MIKWILKLIEAKAERRIPTIVVDTSVMVDMLLSIRTRHPEALTLAKQFRHFGFQPTLPCHAFFEIATAIRNERMQKEGKISMGIFTKEFPLGVKIIPIDMQFVHEHIDHTIPYMKAGDLIFVAIAKKQGLAIVTEDKLQYERATQGGVKAFTIKQFLEELEKNPPS